MSRIEGLEPLERLEPGQRMWGEFKWNGYSLGNRDVGYQKNIFSA
jgi:hypothetical protein